jgi:hypothetical protein
VNPALIGYDLRPIAELVGSQKQAEVTAEVERRLAAQRVTTNATLIAMMVDVVPYTSDRGSEANQDLTVGRPRYVPGWYYFGQWGLRQSGDFPGGAKALLLRNAPGSDNSAIVEATGFARHWGKSSSWGLFSANAPTGYTACGDLYESTDNPGRIGWRTFYGCLRNDLVEDAPWADPDLLWGDWGSKARDDGSAWSFQNNDRAMITLSGNWSAAPHLFKVTGGYNRPGITPKRPRMDRIKVLSDNWL